MQPQPPHAPRQPTHRVERNLGFLALLALVGLIGAWLLSYFGIDLTSGFRHRSQSLAVPDGQPMPTGYHDRG